MRSDKDLWAAVDVYTDIPSDWQDAAEAAGEQPPAPPTRPSPVTGQPEHPRGWALGTYIYVAEDRSLRVYDAAQHCGGLDPLYYVLDADGGMPPFRDGTPVRFGVCDECSYYHPLIHVASGLPGPLQPLRQQRWLCVNCVPPASMPR